MGTAHRLFIALPLPDELIAALAPLQNGVPDARWMPPDALHLTLRFIGNVDRGVAEDVVALVEGLAIRPFTLHPHGGGWFDRAGIPHALWVGVKPSQELPQVQARISHAVTDLGLEPEHRRFTPHITLARLGRGAAGHVAEWVQRADGHHLPALPVTAAVLYDSLRGADAPVYRALALSGGAGLEPADDDLPHWMTQAD